MAYTKARYQSPASSETNTANHSQPCSAQVSELTRAFQADCTGRGEKGVICRLGAGSRGLSRRQVVLGHCPVQVRSRCKIPLLTPFPASTGESQQTEKIRKKGLCNLSTEHIRVTKAQLPGEHAQSLLQT
eukprot:gnl/TRDRNA2_/TRDRNA2_177458_c1_seq2.p2 gnl/TRDRNA2_/TRDRNA2_177458_c1~~gnl/TRDRNA2_/TRDRNA2_177458_c1_seq2.p2  ORF type:complete len:144 (+),score=2.55 gnl/TRDRNA2_/TRDRNA2_177458_c1_seq2:45-434(+)